MKNFLVLCLFASLPVAAQHDASQHPAESQASSDDEHGDHRAAPETGLLGDYEMGRDASGTSWQPGSTPTQMFHFNAGSWSFMVHGFANFVYQDEPEPRGSEEFFGTNMIMFSARHASGGKKLGFRFMGSAEPTMGSTGYPVLLQTGETSDGSTPLIDRQHPHDAFMELAVTYSLPLGERDAFFVYFAPVGDPALGPPVFMHRFSGIDNPIAPVSHHWLDSTHISFGVLTAGWVVSDKAKIDGSIFNGAEPDEKRWGFDSFRLNSYALRFTATPNPDWTFQASMAKLTEPERLHQGIDVLRMTASLTYNRPLDEGNWQTTVAWGRNKREAVFVDGNAPPPTTGGHTHFVPGQFTLAPTQVQNALLLETGLNFKSAHTVFARFEWAEKDELFVPADRRHSEIYDVTKLNVGYVLDFARLSQLRIGGGAYGVVHTVPEDLEIVYGSRTPTSFGVFLRLKIM